MVVPQNLCGMVIGKIDILVPIQVVDMAALSPLNSDWIRSVIVSAFGDAGHYFTRTSEGLVRTRCPTSVD